ncbi:MAG: dihydrodipicolinate synthase family protein [Victivallales bacterium]|nr:dihydrodipicolinate synthase family protein [Victivallales bacterium]
MIRKKTYSASITPLYEDGTLDRQGLKNILERNIRHGLDGVFLLGSMGEWGSFSDDFKEDYIKTATEIAGDRLEILAGINATSLPLSLNLMKRYSKYSFDSYVFMLPAKTSSLDPVKSVLKVLDAADRPVYFYYCPPNNGITFSLGQFATIMAHPNLKGIKNSSSNMWLRRELLWLKRERGFKTLLFEGQEWAVDEALMVGCDGMISGMGALAAKIMVGIARAVDDGNFAEAIRLENVFIGIFHGVYGIDLANVWNGQKYALVKMGLISTPYTIAQEMDSLTDEAKTRVEKCLEQYKEELD